MGAAGERPKPQLLDITDADEEPDPLEERFGSRNAATRRDGHGDADSGRRPPV